MSESYFQSQQLKILKKLKKMGILDYIRINVGGLPAIKGGGGRRKNPMKGMSDVYIVARRRTGWLENKKPGKKRSAEQVEFQRNAKEMGGARIGVAENMEQFYRFLQVQMGIYI